MAFAVAVAGPSPSAAYADTGDLLLFSGEILTGPVPVASGNGGFGYVSGTCSYVHGGVSHACNLDWNGQWSNVVCGTGTVAGAASVTNPSTGATYWSGGLSVTFVAAQGVIQAVGGPGYSTGSGWAGFVPAVGPGPLGAGSCANGYTVVGSVLMTS